MGNSVDEMVACDMIAGVEAVEIELHVAKFIVAVALQGFLLLVRLALLLFLLQQGGKIRVNCKGFGDVRNLCGEICGVHGKAIVDQANTTRFLGTDRQTVLRQ